MCMMSMCLFQVVRMPMAKRKVLCAGYIASLRHATKHARKVLAKIDAENNALDQYDLFKEIENERREN